MGKYIVKIAKSAEKDLSILKRLGNKANIEKVATIFKEVGTGKPEQLKFYNGEVWSRRINKKDRLVYEIYEEEILVGAIQTLGHYQDR